MPPADQSYLHDLDPIAIPVHIGPIDGIRWYGLAYAAGFVIAWLVVRWMARSRRSPLEPPQVGDLMTWTIVGVLLGGRLGYGIFYDRTVLFGWSTSFPWWKFLAIFEGGMASHGGIAGAIVACVLFARRRGLSSLHVLDLAALVCPPGLFLGRVSNFVNGELWGHPLPAAKQAAPPWWSIKYPQEILDPAFAHREALEPLRQVVGGEERFLENVVAAAAAGRPEVVTPLKPLLTAYYPSQLIQAFTEGPLLLTVLVIAWWGPRRPGVVGSWFLIAYALLRIASETLRQPDAGVALWLGLSRGQALSVVMALAGVVGLIVTSRRDVPPLGGLVRR
jgi:phosphatidylglycerol:prolipoprotein diacylglycerol transferase